MTRPRSGRRMGGAPRRPAPNPGRLWNRANPAKASPMTTTASLPGSLALLLVLVAGFGAWAALGSQPTPVQATSGPVVADSPRLRPRVGFAASSFSEAAPGATARTDARTTFGVGNGNGATSSAWIPAGWQGGLPADLQDATLAIRNLGNTSGLADGRLATAPTVARRRPRRAPRPGPSRSCARRQPRLHRFLHTSSR